MPVTGETTLEAPPAAPGTSPTTAAQPVAGPSALVLRAPMTPAWPLDVDDAFAASRPGDPWVAIVRDSIADYRSGRAERASQQWHDEIRWRIAGDGGLHGEWTGAEQIFNLHRTIRRLTDDTFRQRLIALEGSAGPFVDAHLRTTATRAGRSLDIATLVVFELAGGRISCVTELPGDRDAWRFFWAD